MDKFDPSNLVRSTIDDLGLHEILDVEQLRIVQAAAHDRALELLGDFGNHEEIIDEVKCVIWAAVLNCESSDDNAPYGLLEVISSLGPAELTRLADLFQGAGDCSNSVLFRQIAIGPKLEADIEKLQYRLINLRALVYLFDKQLQNYEEVIRVANEILKLLAFTRQKGISFNFNRIFSDLRFSEVQFLAQHKIYSAQRKLDMPVDRDAMRGMYEEALERNFNPYCRGKAYQALRDLCIEDGDLVKGLFYARKRLQVKPLKASAIYLQFIDKHAKIYLELLETDDVAQETSENPFDDVNDDLVRKSAGTAARVRSPYIGTILWERLLERADNVWRCRMMRSLVSDLKENGDLRTSLRLYEKMALRVDDMEDPDFRAYVLRDRMMLRDHLGKPVSDEERETVFKALIFDFDVRYSAARKNAYHSLIDLYARQGRQDEARGVARVALSDSTVGDKGCFERLLDNLE